jgi:SsrA-binding protein
MAILTTNKKARFDYHILESYQAGLSLSGQMVKEIRGQRVTLSGAFVVFQHNRLEIIGLSGQNGTLQNVPLLLQKKEISEIVGKLSQKGVTCVVLNLKTVGRWIKAEIAVVRGKKNYDKRESLKKRDLDRERARNLI